MKFYSFDELRKHIVFERRRQDVRVIRFINVNTIESWSKLINYLNASVEKTIKLSDYCLDKDLMPNLVEVFSGIKQLSSSDSILVLPISAYSKLTGIDSSILLKFARIELSPSNSPKRIFIPLYRMENELANLSGYDKRIENYAFCLQEGGDTNELCSVTIINNDLKGNFAGIQVDGFREYLKYWEDKPVKLLVLRTQWANTIKELNLAQNVTVYSSYFDILKSKTIESGRLSESWAQSPERWEKLIDILGERNSIIEALEFHFGKQNAQLEDLMINWSEYDEFNRWLIWLWCKLEPGNRYIGNLMKLADVRYVDFATAMINGIFQLLNNAEIERFVDERAKLLEQMGVKEKPKSFWDNYDRVSDPYEKITCLTAASNEEKMEIVKLFGEAIKESKELDKWKDTLKRIYPELYYYSCFYPSAIDEVNRYFSSYIESKLTDSVNSGHLQLVDEIAGKQLWWGITPRNLRVDEQYNSAAVLMWVDALGVEWLGLIQYLLTTTYNGIFYSIYLSAATMPTVTGINKDWLENRNHEEYRKIDKFNHDTTAYSYPVNIVEQVNMVCEVMQKAVDLLQRYERVIISSDHGCSRLAVIGKQHTYSVDDDVVVENYGRTCIKNGKTEEQEYIGTIDYNDSLIFSNYNRFSIQGNPAGEIHGGATLEEILVPVIILSKQPLDERLDVELLTHEVSVKAGKKAEIRVKASRAVDKLLVVFGNIRVQGKLKGTEWSFEVDLPRGKHEGKIIYEGRTISEITVVIKRGISDNLDI